MASPDHTLPDFRRRRLFAAGRAVHGADALSALRNRPQVPPEPPRPLSDFPGQELFFKVEFALAELK